MDIILISTLFVLCVFFMALEIFIIPGTSLAGIVSAACLIGANVLVFDSYGLSAGIIVLAASLIVCLVAGIWMLRSKALDRISLKRTIDSTAATEEQLSVKVGDRGIALTRLALIGNADFDGKIVQVQSADGFLDEKTPVVITRVIDGQVWVKRTENLI
ncbi:NfeD family protein [Bacteroides sp. OF04-15BH]|jgi:membrane-bound ClpP family serine protease|uniref:NfeD family protein n=1 Tax=Bacteroides sp. OF04-15BH TaxID=2292281 RepID=UPI000E5333CD|nr:NfeD family protein [Bacteroides sp. OF04-15BH]RHP66948.1 nodulation protein NfeD [Bacteroides sp. OF04-15BH]